MEDGSAPWLDEASLDGEAPSDPDGCAAADEDAAEAPAEAVWEDVALGVVVALAGVPVGDGEGLGRRLGVGEVFADGEGVGDGGPNTNERTQ
jgi:hypothetical protein